MKIKRFSEEQIIGYLKEAEAGIPVKVWTLLDPAGCQTGGRCEIRTREELAPLPVFKTGAFNRSANLPNLNLNGLRGEYFSTRCPCTPQTLQLMIACSRMRLAAAADRYSGAWAIPGNAPARNRTR